jgi:RNA polymerase sigma-70 factor (ECF subfamily)
MIRSLNNETHAYETLLKRVAVMIRGYLFNLLGSARTEEKVEDLVQDVLIAIHRKKHLYHPTRAILPWLFAIARYRLIDQARADKRRPNTTILDETVDFSDDNHRLNEEGAFVLEELLSDLSPRQKDILVLAKVDGIPLADIAQRFNMSLSAVKVTVHRTIQKLRKKNHARLQ